MRLPIHVVSLLGICSDAVKDPKGEVSKSRSRILRKKKKKGVIEESFKIFLGFQPWLILNLVGSRLRT